MIRAFLTGLILASLVSQGLAEEKLHQLHRVEIKESSEKPEPSWKKSVTIVAGDFIEAQLFGGSYPGGMIDNVKVEIKGGGVIGSVLSKEAVLRVDQKGAVGGIELVVLLKSSVAGKAEVSLTPTGGGVQPKTYVLDVTVNAK